jgi:hypothetical protein
MQKRRIFMSPAAASTWFSWSAIVLCVFAGLMLALGAYPATAVIANLFVDACFWPIDGAQSISTPEARLMSGICGGAFVGLGAIIWRNAQALKAGDLSAKTTILIGILAWWATDSTFSAVAGAPMNVLFNLILLAVFLAPVMRRQRG